MEHKINLALQLLPLHTTKDNAYRVIDIAISLIQKSGLSYKVSPYETTIEGTYEEVMELIENIRQTCHAEGANEIIMNIKLHSNSDRDVLIEDKMVKYN